MKQIGLLAEYFNEVQEASLTMQRKQRKKQQELLQKQKENAISSLHHKPGKKALCFSLLSNLIILLSCILCWSYEQRIWLTSLLILDVISICINCVFLIRCIRK